MKKEYLVGGLVGAVVVLVIGVVGYLLLAKNSTAPISNEQTLEENTNTNSPSVVVTNNNQNKDAKTYRNSAFEFQYPAALTINSQGEAVKLTHSVPYRHTNPCDMRDGAKPLDKITDFDISISLLSGGLKEAVQATVDKNVVNDYLQGNSLKVTQGFIDEYNAGPLKGYKVTSGAEGCGEYTYYFPTAKNSVLFVKRIFVPELQPSNADYKTFLKIPNIISPEQEENIFKAIISSIKLGK